MLPQSTRLYLREATLDDAEVFFRMDSDPEVMRHIGGTITSDPEVTRAAVGRAIAAYGRRPGFGMWACCLRDGHRCVGWVGLKPSSLPVHAPASGEIVLADVGHIQIGYRLLKDDWGRGYATEMSVEVLQYGFAQLGVERILAVCRPENVASARVMTKAGLVYAARGQYGAAPIDVYAASKASWQRPV